MTIKKLSSIYLLILLFLPVSALMLCGCDSLLLNERQKVVKDSHDAMCKARDLQAMRPFVTTNSMSLLDISKPVVAL